MRMKYPDDPAKFLDSEVDLDDAVKRMMVVAGSPELYPDFARTQVGLRFPGACLAAAVASAHGKHGGSGRMALCTYISVRELLQQQSTPCA